MASTDSCRQRSRSEEIDTHSNGTADKFRICPSKVSSSSSWRNSIDSGDDIETENDCLMVRNSKGGSGAVTEVKHALGSGGALAEGLRLRKASALEPGFRIGSESQRGEYETKLVSHQQTCFGSKTNDSAAFFTADIVTYSFLMIWIGLCLVMLLRKKVMWRVGAAAAVFELISLASHWLSPRMLPHLRTLDPGRLDLWHNSAVCYCHSLAVSLGVALVLLLEHHTFASEMYRGHAMRAYTIVCMSCGFFAYDLWDTLRKRLYNPRSPSILAHNAVLLGCFTTALYRDVTINYLILTLVCEVNSVFLHQRRLLALAGAPTRGAVSQVNWVCIWATFLLARVLAHGLIPIRLALDYKSFPRGVEFPMAMGGIVCFNLLNFELGRDLMRVYRKELGATSVGAEGERCDVAVEEEKEKEKGA